MRETSQLWQIIAKEEYRVESKVVIDNETYNAVIVDSADPTPVRSCVMRRQLMSQTSPIGNANISVLQMTYVPRVQPAKKARVTPYCRLIRANGTYTEYIRLGTFFISTRKRNKKQGTLTITCYDAMRMAEQPFLQEGDTGEDWPRTPTAVVADIAERMGVLVDERTVLNDSYEVEYPEDPEVTCREMLEQIAIAHGGNWTISGAGLPLYDAGSLYLVRLGDLPDATGYLVNEDDAAITFGGVRILV